MSTRARDREQESKANKQKLAEEEKEPKVNSITNYFSLADKQNAT